jgi:hypothetical protein
MAVPLRAPHFRFIMLQNWVARVSIPSHVINIQHAKGMMEVLKRRPLPQTDGLVDSRFLRHRPILISREELPFVVRALLFSLP